MQVLSRFGADFILGVVAMALTVAATVVLVVRTSRAQTWVEHSNEVNQVLNEVDRLNTAGELAARDYAITGQLPARDRYRALTQRLLAAGGRLAELVADNPLETARVARLRTLITAAAAARDGLVLSPTPVDATLMRAYSESTAVTETTGAWWRSMDQLYATERSLLVERSETFRRDAVLCLGVAIGGGLASALVLLASGARRRRALQGLERSQGTLEHKEAELRSIVESVAVGIVVTDGSLRVRGWNAAAAETFGYGPEAMQDLPLSTILPDFTLPGAAQLGRSLEVTGRRADGTELPLELSLTTWMEGTQRRYTGVLKDIARRKRAETELRESERRFRSIVDLAAVGIAHVALDGTFVRLNRRYAEILGYTPVEMAGVKFQQVTEAEDLAQDLDNVARLLRGEAETYTMDKRYVRKDGRRVWVALSVSLVRDDAGKPAYLIAAILDISARKAAEAQLREAKDVQEAQIRVLTEAMPLGLLYVDAAQHLRYCNPQYCSWVRRPYHQVVDRPLREVVGEAVYAVMRPRLERALSGERLQYEARPVYADRTRDVRVEMVPDVKDGTVRGCIVVTIDVSADVAAQESLRDAKAAAEQANQAKSLFLAAITHELRTPLTLILGHAELLLHEQRLSPAVARSIEVMQRNGQQLLTLVNDLLDLSKVEQGRLEVEKTHFRLAPFLAELMEEMRLRARQKGLELTLSVHGPVPEAIDTDPTRLRQILLNLLGNAIKFTGEGQVDLVVRLIEAGGRASLEFLVADTGPGISPEGQGRLFQPFTQADRSIARKYGGTGLGLNLAQQMARRLGGDVMLVRSAPGEGSVFAATVDVGAVADLSIVPTLRRDDRQPEAAEATVCLAGVRVLLADDFPDSRALLKRMLEGASAQVDVAGDGREAVTKALADPYDVVLMDHQMPVLSGLEATRELRRRGYAGPVVALSAGVSPDERERWAAVGCTEFLAKPVLRASLLGTVARLSHFTGGSHDEELQRTGRETGGRSDLR